MVPLSLGRLIFSAAPGLSFFTHDPLCLVVGVIVMLRCIGVVAKMALLGSRSEWVAKLSRIPMRLYWRGTFKIFCRLFLSTAVQYCEIFLLLLYTASIFNLLIFFNPIFFNSYCFFGRDDLI